MRTRLRWLAAGALALVTSAFLPGSPAGAESNGGVRVMPLGDSITEGTQVPGGYRIGLWQRLTAGSYQVDFVGSQFNGPATLGDHDHEGHPGWRIDQINANIVTWLRNTTPHTVLLHIGTNDVLQNFDIANAVRAEKLIHAVQAACRYSWMTPPRRSCRRTARRSIRSGSRRSDRPRRGAAAASDR
jgi:lysophospholipase L1-like esterase